MRAVLSRLLCRQSLPILLPRRPQVREDALKKQPLGSRAETHAAIRTLLASLGDPFTRFLDPEQYAALRRSTAGSVTGVGVEVSFSPRQGSGAALLVIAPAPGGPAERAGIRPGDEILAIDGQDTSTLSLYAAGENRGRGQSWRVEGCVILGEHCRLFRDLMAAAAGGS
jgi:C-terminal processing protease CtpA/Prc